MCFRIAILLVCLSATAIKSEENIKKCPTDVKDPCGLNAKCYDDENDSKYNKYQGAYCQCDEGFAGPPPNCRFCVENDDCNHFEVCNQETRKCEESCRTKKCPKHHFCNYSTNKCLLGCNKNDQCRDDEYCSDDNKCQKICDDFSCGDNSVCELKDRVKYCSCADGYRPVKGKGCVKIVENNENLSCDGSCADHYSNCSQDGNKIFCYCNEEYSHRYNPFEYCQAPIPQPTSRPILKPVTDDQISCAAIACLSLG